MSLRINYASIDAGVHFKNALYTINFQKVDGDTKTPKNSINNAFQTMS